MKILKIVLVLFLIYFLSHNLLMAQDVESPSLVFNRGMLWNSVFLERLVLILVTGAEEELGLIGQVLMKAGLEKILAVHLRI